MPEIRPSLEEIFDRLCPYYLMYGMTYDEYWHGDPWAAKAYREAFEEKQKHENLMLWLQGMYVFHGFEVCMANSFSKKGTPPQKYPEKPYDIFPKTEAEKQADAEKNNQQLADMLTQWGKRWNMQHNDTQ